MKGETDLREAKSHLHISATCLMISQIAEKGWALNLNISINIVQAHFLQ